MRYSAVIKHKKIPAAIQGEVMIGSTNQIQAAPRSAVVGAGYWGKNLARNFHDICALAAISDSDQERLLTLSQN
jgi:hypothetical protein